jgi:hypothetical protein
MMLKNPPPLAQLLERAALARQILTTAMAALPSAFVGCLHFIISSVLEL